MPINVLLISTDVKEVPSIPNQQVAPSPIKCLAVAIIVVASG
jgi:hypothetical protein